MESSRQRGNSSQSRELIEEFGRLSVLQVQQDRNVIDRYVEALRTDHLESLAAANQHHQQVYEHARKVLEAHELQLRLDREKQRQEDEQRLITLRREEAERLRQNEARLLEEQRAAEAAERAVEEQRRQREAEAQRLKQEREKREADERQAREDAERRTKEERDAAEAKAKQAAIQASQQKSSTPTAAPRPVPVAAAVPAPPTAQSSSLQASPALASKEADHRRYLEIHKNLKALRKFMKEQSLQPSNRELKTVMGDGRRKIQKCVSQLVGDSTKNKGPQSEILGVLRSALKYPHPQVKVTDYLFSPPTGIPDANGPGLLLYFMNILSKRIIRQFIDEAAIKPKAADPVGILASSMFAQPDLLWNGYSLIDILTAKYHKVCPVLFGISGSDNSTQGKKRLGWHVEEGQFCTPQRHNERMTGLGAGFSAIALRNFDKSKNTNPFPPYKFWWSLANILNLPGDQIMETHVVLLKAMIEHSWDRILLFFGNAGKAALRMACVDFPGKSRKEVAETAAARGLKLLPDLWKRDFKVYV